MNVYLNIDPTWSYRFLTKNKKIIAEYDFCAFTDRFLTVAVNYLVSHIHYNQTKDHQAFQVTNAQITRLCDDYPTLGHVIPKAYHELLHTHINALGVIKGTVNSTYPIIDDAYLLTGVVLEQI